MGLTRTRINHSFAYSQPESVRRHSILGTGMGHPGYFHNAPSIAYPSPHSCVAPRSEPFVGSDGSLHVRGCVVDSVNSIILSSPYCLALSGTTPKQHIGRAPATYGWYKECLQMTRSMESYPIGCEVKEAFWWTMIFDTAQRSLPAPSEFEQCYNGWAESPRHSNTWAKHNSWVPSSLLVAKFVQFFNACSAAVLATIICRHWRGTSESLILYGLLPLALLLYLIMENSIGRMLSGFLETVGHVLMLLFAFLARPKSLSNGRQIVLFAAAWRRYSQGRRFCNTKTGYIGWGAAVRSHRGT